MINVTAYTAVDTDKEAEELATKINEVTIDFDGTGLRRDANPFGTYL